MRLSLMNNGQPGTIRKVVGPCQLRLGELGFLEGQRIHRMLGDPIWGMIVCQILDSVIAMRYTEAENIDVEVDE